MIYRMDQFWDRFTPYANREFCVHLMVAILCIPVYNTGFYALFGLLLSPYLLWLLFKGRSEYLLPLATHMMYGSQQRYVVAFGCFVYCIAHFNQLSRYKLQSVFFVYILIFPFFIWYTWKRYRLFGGGIGAGGTFNGLGYYLAFAPFFYSVLARIRITRETFLGSVYLSAGYLLFVGIHVLTFSRFQVWAMNSMPIMFLWLFLSKKRKGLSFLFLLSFIGCIICALGFLGVSGWKLTFTQLGVSVIGCFYIVLARFYKSFAKLLSPLVLFVISALATTYAITSFYEKRGTYSADIEYSELKIDSFDTFKEKLFRKTFDDRAPLWTAAWDGICQQFSKDPIWVEPMPISGEILKDNGEAVEIRLMAHNIALLLLQEYGLYGGLGLYLIYLWLWSKREQRIVMACDYYSPYLPVAAGCIGHAVVGGFTGQYVMNIEFSFLLYGMLGSCYFHYFDRPSNLKGGGFWG